MERRLGRGLGSLLPPTRASEGPSDILVKDVRPNPHQPRREFDDEALHELSASIRNHGVLQPIVVRRAEGGFELVAGERRLRASKLAGKGTIPAIVRDEVSDADMLELALVENVQRRDLNAIERARGFAEMIARLDLNQAEVADRVGLKRSTVSNHLRLLDLPEEIQASVASHKLSMGHAKALLALASPAEQLEMAREIVRQGLSVRDAELATREAKGEASSPTASGEKPNVGSSAAAAEQPWARSLQARIQDRLGTHVRVLPGPGDTGQIQIRYFNREDLDRICEVLAPRPKL